MTLSTRQDRFDKADATHQEACAEVNRAYDAWSDACERLKRVGKERMEAWRDLMDASANGEQR